MKIMIPSFGRAGTIRTHKLARPNDEVHVVVHTKEEMNWYGKNPSLKQNNLTIHMSGVPLGVANQRNWIIDNLMAPNEWALMADDNIDCLTRVREDLYGSFSIDKESSPKKLAEIFKHPLAGERFLSIAEKDIHLAGAAGVKFIGYATNQNPFFRTKKYRYAGYVTTKLSFIKKSELRFEPGFVCHDDVQFSCENILKFGGVLINNFVYPHGPHYELGGIGPANNRIQAKVAEDLWLMRTYPGLLRFKKKPGVPLEAEVNFRLYTQEQIDEWRKSMNYRRAHDEPYTEKQPKDTVLAGGC